LLKKLIHFDTLILDHDNDAIKHQLYELFFTWKAPGGDAEAGEEQEAQ